MRTDEETISAYIHGEHQVAHMCLIDDVVVLRGCESRSVWGLGGFGMHMRTAFCSHHRGHASKAGSA